jgi:GT2 family glycosyltransferase
MSADSIDIVVFPRDRFSVFPQCIDAIYDHTSEPFNLIAVAGGVDPETKRYLNRLAVERPNFSVVLPDQLLLQGEARNLGLRHAHQRLCVLLENDTIVHENWLTPMLECLREQGTAAVMPLIHWYRGIHAAGCMFHEQQQNGKSLLRHSIIYNDIRRKQIDYPESHCVLLDRQLLSGDDIFDEVEPFDVDLGLTLRSQGQTVYFEPRSVVTYAAPPPWELRDIPPTLLRWDLATWERHHRRFAEKWPVVYDPASKITSYRRLRIKLSLLRWFPNRLTVSATNVGVGIINRLIARAKRNHTQRSFG